jgi:hypothetical protein
MCYQSAGKMHCQGPDDNGCFYWGELDPCLEQQMCSPKLNECVPTTPPTCDQTNECDYVGQKTCMNDTKYRECHYGDTGCLVWDCGT